MAFMRTTYAFDGSDIAVRYHHSGSSLRCVDIRQPDVELSFRGDRNHLLALFRAVETLLLEDVENAVDPDDLDPIDFVIGFGADSEYANNGEPF